jgi:hypothetical protein
VIAKFL